MSLIVVISREYCEWCLKRQASVTVEEYWAIGRPASSLQAEGDLEGDSGLLNLRKYLLTFEFLPF
jgi:hypothetical protein